MEKHKVQKNHKDRLFILLGFTVIGILFLLYSRMQDFSITPDSLQSVERLAISFYVLLLLSFIAIAYGLYRYHQRKMMENLSNILSVIASTTWNNKSKKIFVAVFISYGMFFAFTSGIIVYQPDVIFSHHYNAMWSLQLI